MTVKKKEIKKYLQKELIKQNLFWSYEDVEPGKISDDILIEKVLLYFDIDRINDLFRIFPLDKVKRIWANSDFFRDPVYRSMNLLFAYLYFNIKEPEKLLDEATESKYHEGN